MKKVKIISIILFFTILAIPLLTFNFKPDQISEIDNRKLTENPFTSGADDVLEELTSYFEDRIGLRGQMINGYTLLHDRLFSEMVHPSYTYGQDGYVYFKMSKNNKYDDYEKTFVDFVDKAKIYCESRDIPFVFAFSPSKISVMDDKLPIGVNYDYSWVYEMFDEMEQKNIRYVDNLQTLSELYDSGEKVFNKQYNAGHWNDLGAFYGVNQILKELQNDYPTMHINTFDEFQIENKLQTSLMVSQFPIEDYDTIFTLNNPAENITEVFKDELKVNEQYRTIGYYVNENVTSEDKPRVLVFQGSYMNGMGYKFFENACAEYIHVHDYQNVIDMEYYINVFQPDCVVFEAAEYVLNDTYFDSSKMAEKTFNPALSEVAEKTQKVLTESDYVIDADGDIADISVNVPNGYKYYYLTAGDITLDLIKGEDGKYTANVRSDEFNSEKLTLICAN